MDSLKVGVMPREFHYKGQVLSDPNPKMTVKEVISHYSNQYPDLVNGFEKNSEVKDGKMIVEVVTTIGIKG